MDLKEQLYVCTLAEVGNMSQAAEKLFISQPALSSYINNLQERLGARLFTRKNNIYTLTYIGEKYVEKAQKMLQLGNEFNLELSNYVEGIKGRLRIGVQSRRSPYIVPKIYSCFKEKYSNIEIIIRESALEKLEEMILNNKLDLLIYSTIDRRQELEYIHVFDDPILLAINSKSKLRRKAKWLDNDLYQYIDIKDLENETFILPQRNQSLREACEELFKLNKFKAKKIIEIRNIETIMKLVSYDIGIGFNRLSYAKHMSNIEDVVYFNIKQEHLKSELVIAHTKESKEIPNIDNMILSIIEVLNHE